MSRIISYILIITGAFVAIYAQAEEEQNQYILIGGVVVLMMGIYRVSRNIPSKKDQDENNQNESSS
ncbi:hypothetical protein [Psychroserpens jangbogonensis]|uniref:hypothetical protein n=1 Tax=Psychroserpens jangbogonensis TaxID=1484460 RepID=UPI000689A6E8|nr:hypothetical protein [Psychroserpens jangbogonensis]